MCQSIKSWAGRIVLGLMIASFTTGCLAIGGSDRYESKNPTLGKQLQDLKVAHDSGAINDAEYQQARTKLLSTSAQ